MIAHGRSGRGLRARKKKREKREAFNGSLRHICVASRGQQADYRDKIIMTRAFLLKREREGRIF